MTPAPYQRLLSPLRLGPLQLTNRVVFCAHLTGAARDGLPTEQHAAYYAARAAGGAALVITDEQGVHPSDGGHPGAVRGYDPAVVPGYRAITDAVHARGAHVLAQLGHNGAQTSSARSRRPLWAPSPVPDPLVREVPHAVDAREIAELVTGYALAAHHSREGGYDGVELQCSHSSLLGAFLSPATNHRTDAWGGSVQRRARLLLDVVAAVRAVLGSAAVLGVRLAGDELVAGGTTLPDAVAVARLLEATGAVDVLNTSIGVSSTRQDAITPSMRVPAGYARRIPRALKDAVGLPVIGVGRFTDPAQAERALADGDADLVGIVRAQVADPDLVAKARAGAEREIRTCLGCNQECVGRVGAGRWLGCTVNPRAGREATALAAPRRRAQRVVVVGGGPAGLSAAATAAERGHRVTLLEGEEHLGGQVRAAATAPHRAGLGHLVDDLAARARRAGAQLRTGCRGEAAALLAQAPDAVVVATGADPVRPAWSGTLERVVDVRDVLEGRAHPSGSVVVLDELGFHQATSVAELLAGSGCAVEVVTSAMVVGQDLGATQDLRAWTIGAHALGIATATDLVPVAATGLDARGGSGVRLTLLHHPTATTTSRVADWVVCCHHQRSREELWRALAGAPFAVHRVGDALAPRRAHAAVLDGDRVAVAL